MGQFAAQAKRALSANQLNLVHSICLLGLTRFPDSVELLSILGWAHARSDDLKKAAAFFRHALSLDESHHASHAGLAAFLASGGNYDEAIDHYRYSLQLEPRDPRVLFNYGCSLLELRRLEEAIGAFEEAIGIDPELADAYHNLGIAHGQQGKWSAALEWSHRSLQFDPDWREARLLRSYARIALGNFAQGWDDYEARAESYDHYTRLLDLPRWQGPRDSKQSIAVIPEQGIGTQIMFASCLADLASHVPHCTLGCDLRLISLFRRSFPAIECVADGLLPLLAKKGAFDSYVMAGSLPGIFRRARAEFPGSGYLTADPLAGRRWKKRLESLGSGLKVGISWRGGASTRDARHRCTEPGEWRETFRLPGIHWINLQYDADEEELADWERAAATKMTTWDALDLKYDLEGTASLISQLDLVISVVNSTVHLAGALDVPTWTLLPRGGEWRWLDRGESCVWHGSVRLFRQQLARDWTDVFASVHRRLKAFGAALGRHSARVA